MFHIVPSRNVEPRLYIQHQHLKFCLNINNEIKFSIIIFKIYLLWFTRLILIIVIDQRLSFVKNAILLAKSWSRVRYSTNSRFLCSAEGNNAMFSSDAVGAYRAFDTFLHMRYTMIIAKDQRSRKNFELLEDYCKQEIVRYGILYFLKERIFTHILKACLKFHWRYCLCIITKPLTRNISCVLQPCSCNVTSVG